MSFIIIVYLLYLRLNIADHVFQLMEFVDNTVDYNKPTDVLDMTVLTDILEKARMRMKYRTRSKSDDEDRDLYP